jgi:hypothetical protein
MLQLIQELGAKIVLNKKSKFWGGEIRRTVADMELICGITQVTNEWFKDPKCCLEQLDQELERIKEDWVPWRT